MKWIIFLLLLSGKMVYAQSLDTLQYHSIKIDFANFLDDFPALLFSYQHPIGKNLYLTHEGGPILPSFLDDRKTSGFKLKEEIRLVQGEDVQLICMLVWLYVTLKKICIAM